MKTQARMERRGFRRWRISGTLPCGTAFHCGGSSPEDVFQLFLNLQNSAAAQTAQRLKSDD